MYCGRCGQELNEGARFCGSCGAPADLFSRVEGGADCDEASLRVDGGPSVASAVSQAKAKGRRRIPLVLLLALALSLAAGAAFASWWVYTEVVLPAAEAPQEEPPEAGGGEGEPEKATFGALVGELTTWQACSDDISNYMLRVEGGGSFETVMVITQSRNGYYCCTGHFDTPVKVDDCTYTFGVSEINDSVYSMAEFRMDGSSGIYFDRQSKMVLYLPGKSISDISENSHFSRESLPSESGLLIEPVIVIDDGESDSFFFVGMDSAIFDEHWRIME